MMTLLKLLALPVTAPSSAVMSIFRAIHEEVERELDTPEALKARLVNLQQMLERGEISLPDYELLEEDILNALDAIYDASEDKE